MITLFKKDPVQIVLIKLKAVIRWNDYKLSLKHAYEIQERKKKRTNVFIIIV